CVTRSMISSCPCSMFTYTPPTASYTLSLHDALPICQIHRRQAVEADIARCEKAQGRADAQRVGPSPSERERDHRALALEHQRRRDRKSTRLNSSHVKISYAVFCLKKKTQHEHETHTT